MIRFSSIVRQPFANLFGMNFDEKLFSLFSFFCLFGASVDLTPSDFIKCELDGAPSLPWTDRHG
jgi:hypothetical protein